MGRRNWLQRLCTTLVILIGLAAWRPALAQTHDVVTESYGGRDMLVYVPTHLPPDGSRALVVVLHGGLGNAQRIASLEFESGLNMNAVAEKDGFIVAYLNGTPVTRYFGDRMLGWNAGGGCCGLSAQNGIDDGTYIQGAVADLEARYGIDPARVYGMGHSNGAMMTQRLMCETTLYAAAVAISGPLNLPATACPDARGKRILAIHGANDRNVPIAGGQGTEGLSRTPYRSEDRSSQTFIASGAAYTLEVVPGADHRLDDIDAVIEQTDGVSIAEKAARFFGLADQKP
jgi:polyhydroxybutyrate depolymerase